MKIAYIGPAEGTSLHRANALRRLSHQVTIIDPWAWLGKSKWMSRWLYNTGGAGVGLLINHRIQSEVKGTCPDLIWVTQGEFLDQNCLRLLRNIGKPIVNRINDDPFGDRDKRRFAHFLKALPFYDLIMVPREVNVTEAKKRGARQVMRFWMTADEMAHSPRELMQEEKLFYASEVAFIGTWMPERGIFLADLIDRGIPLSIWGDNWQKARDWLKLKPYWLGPGLRDDKSYSAAILSAKICLGLLSKGNRDLYTSRSIEIPALGGLFCAERTTEHLEMYEEGKEAVFWTGVDECAEICKELLANDARRMEIASKGHERALRNNLFNEPVLASIIETVMRQNQTENVQ